MSSMLILVVMFLSMILLLLTGRHVFLIIGAVGTISALALWGTGGDMMPFLGGYSFMKWYPLLAIPPFILMGLTLTKSGIADQFFQTLYIWMGRVRGGLGIGTVGLCSLIAAMSGTNVAATVTAGTVALPAMLKRNYDKLMITGIVQAGGALGFLIPPSVVLIFFGMIARVSIGHLWLGGILPGILLASMFIIYIGIRCHYRPSLGPPIAPEERVGWKQKIRSLKSGIGPIIIIFAVLGLLFMGVTTLVECAAVGAISALVLAAINRKLTRSVIDEVRYQTLTVSCMIMWIFVVAILFGAVFDGLGAIYAVETMIFSLGGGRWAPMIMMQLSFFLLGTCLDDTALLLIVAPLYIPIVAELGFDLVWFGVLYAVNMQMAFLTPPFGYNLFILRGIVPKDSGITMADIYRSVIPFVGIQAICLGIIMAFPQIVLFLPNLVFGGQ